MWTWSEFRTLTKGGTDFSSSKIPALVSVRNCLRGGKTSVQRYRLSPLAAYQHCLGLIVAKIASPLEFRLDESAPDGVVALQCEVMNDSAFIWMRYTIHGQGLGMRQAYESMSVATGIRAVLILRHYLDGPSQDCLFHILRDYPNDVVELSAYSRSVGVLNWNTLFWEVRGPDVDVEEWRQWR